MTDLIFMLICYKQVAQLFNIFEDDGIFVCMCTGIYARSLGLYTMEFCSIVR